MGWMGHCSSPGSVKNSLRIVYTGPGAHSASSTVGTGGSFPELVLSSRKYASVQPLFISSPLPCFLKPVVLLFGRVWPSHAGCGLCLAALQGHVGEQPVG